MTDKTPTSYIARAQDGSRWRISRQAVIDDMHNYDDEADADDPWPDPMPEDYIEMWLGDNADTIEGWEFVDRPAPDRYWLSEISPEYLPEASQ